MPPQQAFGGYQAVAQPPSAVALALQSLPAAVWGKAALHGLIGYAAGLVVAIIGALLLGVAAASSLGGITSMVGTGGGDAGSGFLIAFQLVSMAFGGRLRFSYGDMAVFFAPILVLVAILVVIFFAARRFLPVGQIASPWLRLLVSALTGLTLAAVTTILAPIFAVRTGGMFISAVSAFSFFSALLFGTVIAFIGNSPKGSLTAFATTKGRPAIAEQAGVAVRALLVHVTILAVVAFVGLVVYAIVTDASSVGPFFALIPTAIPTILGMVVALAHFGTLDGAAGVLGSSSGSSLSMFSLDWWIPLVLILTVVAGVVVSALTAYAARRGVRPNAISWLTTPAVFFVFGLLLQFFARIAVSSGGTFSASGGAWIAAWFFLVFTLFGVLVEVVAQLVIPALSSLIPVGLLNWIARKTPPATSQPHVVRPRPVAPQPVYPQQYAAAPYPPQPQAPYPPQAPTSGVVPPPAPAPGPVPPYPPQQS